MSYAIVYIGAKWCKSCKVIQPQIEELAKMYGVPVDLIDYDTMEEEAQKDVGKVPTVYMFKHGAKHAKYDSNQVASVGKWLEENVSLEAEF